jgi:hypothetical protein
MFAVGGARSKLLIAVERSRFFAAGEKKGRAGFRALCGFAAGKEALCEGRRS